MPFLSHYANRLILMTEKYVQRKKFKLAIEILKYSLSVVLLVIAVFGAAILAGMATPPPTQKSDALIVQVDVDSVRPFSGTLDLVVPGTVKPHREIRIASEVNGKVLKKYPEFQAGSFVLSGTKLAEIDAEDYKADLNIVTADLEQALKRIEENERQIEGEQRNVELAKQNYEIQKRDFERTKRLASALSRSEVDQSRQALNDAQTNLTGRQNALELLRASKTRLQSAYSMAENQQKRSQLNLGRVTIYAPVDGVIVQEMVQENDFVQVGSDIAMFEDVAVAEVRCNLTSSELAWVRKNSKLSVDNFSKKDLAARDIRSLAYEIPKTAVSIYESETPDVRWEGTLERFDGIGRDELTKTIPCRIIIPQPITKTDFGPRALVRNMFVKCRIEVQTSSADTDDELLYFDELALQPGNFLWKVVDNKLEMAKVTVVDRTEKTVEGKRKGLIVVRAIDGNLKRDDQVVVSPLSQPTDGAEVIVAGAANKRGDQTNKDSQSAGQMKEASQADTQEKPQAVSNKGGRDGSVATKQAPAVQPVSVPKR